MSTDSNSHDELLMMIAARAGGIAPLLDAIFSFLYRKTDFYHVMREGENMGFAPGVAEQLLLGHFRKYEALAIKARAKQAQSVGAKMASKQVPAQTSAPLASGPISAGSARSASASVSAVTAAAKSCCGVRTVADASQLPGIDASHLPSATALESAYNGGRTERYVWEQTISDVALAVPLPPGTRSNDIACTISKSHLRLEVKGLTAPVLDADFPCDDRNNTCIWEQVKVDQSFWNFSDGKCSIYLEKERECWWKSALHGHEEIDTTKVDSVKRVEDYDGETQGAIRKIMFDQEQKRQGLPTSEELQQVDVLKKAWDAEGSPFAGTPFNPAVLSQPSGDDFDSPAGPMSTKTRSAGATAGFSGPKGAPRMTEIPDE